MTEVRVEDEVVQRSPAKAAAEGPLLGHSYDGIQEYDNPLPGWWTFLFWVCIAFSLPYVAYYHWGEGTLVAAEFAQDDAQLKKRRAAEALATPVTDEGLRTLAKDAEAMALARALFATKCVTCHGPEGQGFIGPNLTDDYWKNGHRPLDQYKVIREGVAGTGMKAWDSELRPEEVRVLAAYIGTLRGTNPPNPKAPEGTKAP